MLPALLREADSSKQLVEKFDDRLLRDLATLAVLQHACVVFKKGTTKEDRARMQQNLLQQTEEMTRAMRSIDCSNYASSIANAIVSQLSSHTASTLGRLCDGVEDSIENTVKLLPSLGALALEIEQCHHANAPRSFANVLMFFRDSRSDGHEVRRYYSSQYNEMRQVLNAYIVQLSRGGDALSTAVS